MRSLHFCVLMLTDQFVDIHDVERLTKHVSLRLPGDSHDMMGRFKDAMVYDKIARIIGVEPGQFELIEIGQWLLTNRCQYKLGRDQKRIKSRLVEALESHRSDLLPLLNESSTQDAIRKLYLVCLSKNNPKRQEQRRQRRERKKEFRLMNSPQVSPECVMSIERLLNH